MFGRHAATKAGLVGFVAALALVIPSTAQAASTSITLYGFGAYSASKAVGWGQIFSPSGKCVGGRRFKMVAKYPDKPSKVTDSGRSSEDGAISGRVTERELDGANDLIFKVPKTKVGGTKCKGAKASFA